MGDNRMMEKINSFGLGMGVLSQTGNFGSQIADAIGSHYAERVEVASRNIRELGVAVNICFDEIGRIVGQAMQQLELAIKQLMGRRIRRRPLTFKPKCEADARLWAARHRYRRR